MNGRVIAVGDIHGCATALAALVEAVQPTSNDCLVALGDFIDRGPDSRAVVEQLIDLTTRCMLVPIMGNHEEMLLAARSHRIQRRGWLMAGGGMTLESYGSLEGIPEEHIRFFGDCRDFYETETHFFVHANYQYDVPLTQQDKWMLRWRSVDQSPPRLHVSAKIAILGHSAQRSGEILDLGIAKVLDTFCHGGGWLTALDVQSGEVWQADSAGKLRTP